jgi:hypothetical protein
METFSIFYDAASFVLIFGSLLIICAPLWFAYKAKWNILFRDLGVPLGLFWSVVIATGMTVNLSDAKAVGPNTAFMLLTITYGGLLSALGYFSTFKRSSPESHNNQKTAGWKVITFILVTFLGLILWAVFWTANPFPVTEIFINPVALSVFGITIIAAILLSDSDHRVEVLCQASLLSAMISLVFGLIVLYGSFSGDGINEGMYEGLKIAMNGLSYGLLSYISIYIVSYKFGTTERVNAPLMNWHWMEVTGFLIFMFFAPETLRESLMH